MLVRWPRADGQAEEASAEQIWTELGRIGFVLPGSVVMRQTRCQNLGCHCRKEPPELHGPYPTWTHRVGRKTVTRTLSAEQAERYRPFFDNARRLRALVTELEQASVRFVTSAEEWTRKS